MDSLHDTLRQLRADHRQVTQELQATPAGTDDFGRLSQQLANLARTIRATEARLRGLGTGGPQSTLL